MAPNVLHCYVYHSDMYSQCAVAVLFSPWPLTTVYTSLEFCGFITRCLPMNLEALDCVNTGGLKSGPQVG